MQGCKSKLRQYRNHTIKDTIYFHKKLINLVNSLDYFILATNEEAANATRKLYFSK